MKEYKTPEIEFVELKEADIITQSGVCNDYVCPTTYGGTCSGNPYGGN